MSFLGMPKSIRQAFPLLKTFVARFMTTSCLILSRDLSSTSSSVHARQFDEEWLTSVAFVCFRQFMTQSHFFFNLKRKIVMSWYRPHGNGPLTCTMSPLWMAMATSYRRPGPLNLWDLYFLKFTAPPYNGTLKSVPSTVIFAKLPLSYLFLFSQSICYK